MVRHAIEHRGRGRGIQEDLVQRLKGRLVVTIKLRCPWNRAMKPKSISAPTLPKGTWPSSSSTTKSNRASWATFSRHAQVPRPDLDPAQAALRSRVRPMLRSVLEPTSEPVQSRDQPSIPAKTQAWRLQLKGKVFRSSN